MADRVTIVMQNNWTADRAILIKYSKQILMSFHTQQLLRKQMKIETNKGNELYS